MTVTMQRAAELTYRVIDAAEQFVRRPKIALPVVAVLASAAVYACMHLYVVYHDANPTHLLAVDEAGRVVDYCSAHYLETAPVSVRAALEPVCERGQITVQNGAFYMTLSHVLCSARNIAVLLFVSILDRAAAVAIAALIAYSLFRAIVESVKYLRKPAQNGVNSVTREIIYMDSPHATFAERRKKAQLAGTA